MKKTFGILMMVVLVGLLCSCSHTNESGKVTYQLGTAPSMKLSTDEDLKRWKKIETIYATELKGIEGATPDRDSNNAIQMEGVYEKTNAAVVEACKAAEKSATAITLTDGYVVLEVSATYWSSAQPEVIYSHTFGKP